MGRMRRVNVERMRRYAAVGLGRQRIVIPRLGVPESDWPRVWGDLFRHRHPCALEPGHEGACRA